MSGITVEMPNMLKRNLVIPRRIAEEWMIYGMLGYSEHGSEWGCSVRATEQDDQIIVDDYHMYKIEASAAYLETVEGERQAHAEKLIEEGKGDELHLWNGMFHTHPIGSTAHMSGTDVDQLKELAAESYWGFSIICPANRSGSVTNDWLYHIADNRYYDAPIIVKNLKPTIEQEVDARVAEFKTRLDEVMVKPAPRVWRPGMPMQHQLPRGSFQTNNYQNISDMSDDDLDAGMHHYTQQDTTLGYNNRNLRYRVGDLVKVEDIHLDDDAIQGMTDDEMIAYISMQGNTYKVEGVSDTGVFLNGFHFDPAWDKLHIVAYSGSAKAKQLENTI